MATIQGMTDDQLKIIRDALQIYARLGMGQIMYIKSYIPRARYVEEFHDNLVNTQISLTGSQGASLGIAAANHSAQTAYDMFKTIEYEFCKHQKGLDRSVYSRTPENTSDIEVVRDDQSSYR